MMFRLHISISMCINIYIYIETAMERERDIYLCSYATLNEYKVSYGDMIYT